MEKPSSVSRKAWQDARSLGFSHLSDTQIKSTLPCSLPPPTPGASIAPVYIRAQIKQEITLQHFPPTSILEPVVIYKEHKGLAEQHYP